MQLFYPVAFASPKSEWLTSHLFHIIGSSFAKRLTHDFWDFWDCFILYLPPKSD